MSDLPESLTIESASTPRSEGLDSPEKTNVETGKVKKVLGDNMENALDLAEELLAEQYPSDIKDEGEKNGLNPPETLTIVEKNILIEVENLSNDLKNIANQI